VIIEYIYKIKILRFREKYRLRWFVFLR